MLPGPRRIRRSADYRAVMRSGSRTASRTVVVHASTTSSTDPARAGFVVGRSVGPAVTRNRVARRLRHLMAAHLTQLPAGTDVIVRALPAAAGASSGQLGRDLATSLRRVVSRLGQAPGSEQVVSP